MSTSKWEQPRSEESIFTTGLDSIPNNDTSAASATIDNIASDMLYMYAAFEFHIAATARTAGAYVNIYILPSLDNSTFSYGSDTLIPSPSNLAVSIALDAVNAARDVIVAQVLLPPLYFKIIVENQTGVAFTTGNTLAMRRYNVQGT